MVRKYDLSMVEKICKTCFNDYKNHRNDKLYTRSDLIKNDLVSIEREIVDETNPVKPIKMDLICSLVRETEQMYKNVKRKFERVTVYKVDSKTIHVKVFKHDLFDDYNHYKTAGEDVANKIENRTDFQVDLFFE